MSTKTCNCTTCEAESLRTEFELHCNRTRAEADHLKFLAQIVKDWVNEPPQNPERLKQILIERADWIVRVADNLEWWAKNYQRTFNFEVVLNEH